MNTSHSGQSLSLLTDFYQITMAYAYWKNQRYDDEAVFHLFFRSHPFGGDYSIAAGLEQLIDYLENWQFSASDVAYLGSLKDSQGRPYFEEAFLNYLQRLRFSCDIAAVPEGSIVHPHTPLLRIRGPLIQAQLLETPLLNMLNFQTLIATKAARIVKAAQGDPVLEFGLRRAQGVDGGISASRAAYIGGCGATSNVLAGKLFGIPIKGTHAHSWVMSYEEEIQAFEAYASALPSNCIFLVDTYDTIEGIKRAIHVGKGLREKGFEMNGVRLDSGDLVELSKAARKLLDEAGFPDAKVVASNDLNEYRIAEIKEKGGKVEVWGVGTQLATAYEQPALGGVYKLAAICKKGGSWQYRMKLSENLIKVSNPGMIQTYRYYDENNKPLADLMVNELEAFEQQAHKLHPLDQSPPTTLKNLRSAPLLQAIFEKGRCVYEKPSIQAIQQNTLEALSKHTANYQVGLSTELHTLKMNLWEQLRVIPH